MYTVARILEHPILTRGTHTTSFVFHCAQAIVNQTCILVGRIKQMNMYDSMCIFLQFLTRCGLYLRVD